MLLYYMCLILIAYRTHPKYKLVLAANRDEYYDRPTAPAGWWPKDHVVMAGKDLKSNGTWLGITRTGKWAAVTNFRDQADPVENAVSRGHLVRDYLISGKGAPIFMKGLRPKADKFNGFSLILGDSERMWYFSNRENELRVLPAGLYGLGNDLLDSSWPNVARGKAKFSQIIDHNLNLPIDALFELLGDTEIAKDDELPDTGMGKEVERALSPIFVKTPDYGTRSSTVMLMDNSGTIYFEERTIDPQGQNRFCFSIA